MSDQPSLDPTLSTAALAAIEATVNGALKFDPGSRAALAKLSDAIVKVESTAPAFSFLIKAKADEEALATLHFFADPEGAHSVDTHIKGPLLDLLSLAKSSASTLAGSGVEVLGNTALLSDYQDLLRDLDIDWEDALNQVLGDIGGHALAQGIRAKFGWAMRRAATGQRLLSEYLSEEMKTLPAKAELEAFYSEVDGLRMDVERVEQKLKQLINRKNARD